MANRVMLWRVLVGWVGLCLMAGCGEPPPSPVPQTPRDALREKLRQTVSLDEREAPLADVLARLAAQCDVEIHLDELPVISDEAYLSFLSSGHAVIPAGRLVVTQRLRDVELGSVLNVLLRLPGLVYTHTAQGEILVTTPEAAEKLLVTKTYPVAHLLEGHPDFRERDLAAMICRLFASHPFALIAPQDPFAEEGPLDGCFVLPGALVLTRTEEDHDRIAALLADLQTAAGSPAVSLPLRQGPTAAEAAIEKALSTPMEFNYLQTSLADLIDDLRGRCGINIVADDFADEHDVPTLQRPLTLVAEGMTLADALRQALDPLDLTYQRWSETLLITASPPDVRDAVRVYPLADLLPSGSRTAIEDFAVMIDPHVDARGEWHAGPGCLVVLDNDRVHQSLDVLLGQLRSALDPRVVDNHPLPGGEPAARLRQALERRVSVRWQETPLAQIMAWLEESQHVPVVADRENLLNAQAGERLIAWEGEDVRLGAAMESALAEFGMAFYLDPRAQRLVLTSPDDERLRTTGVYRLGQLAEPPLGVSRERLAELIRTHIHPGTWQSMRNPTDGYVDHFTHALVVTHSEVVHAEVRRFLAALRKFFDPRNSGDVALEASQSLGTTRQTCLYRVADDLLGRDGSLEDVARLLDPCLNPTGGDIAIGLAVDCTAAAVPGGLLVTCDRELIPQVKQFVDRLREVGLSRLAVEVAAKIPRGEP